MKWKTTEEGAAHWSVNIVVWLVQKVVVAKQAWLFASEISFAISEKFQASMNQ